MNKGNNTIATTTTATKGKFSTSTIGSNPLITSRVIEGLLMLKKNSIEMQLVGNSTCDNAIVHGFQAGLSVIGDNIVSSSREWSETGKKGILALKELITASIQLAKNVTITENSSLVGKKDVEKDFCYLWEEDGWMITEELLLNVFKATMAFNPIKGKSVRLSEYVLQAELLKAIYLISSGMAESIHKVNMKQASSVIAVINRKFPEAHLLDQLTGTYEIVTEYGKGIFKVDWIFSDINVLACQFVSGINLPTNFICSDIGIDEILAIKLV